MVTMTKFTVLSVAVMLLLAVLVDVGLCRSPGVSSVGKMFYFYYIILLGPYGVPTIRYVEYPLLHFFFFKILSFIQ
jgi:hypothetical protein